MNEERMKEIREAQESWWRTGKPDAEYLISEQAALIETLSGTLAERHNQWLDERRARITYEAKAQELEGAYDSLTRERDELKAVVVALDTPVPVTDNEYGTCVLCGESERHLVTGAVKPFQEAHTSECPYVLAKAALSISQSSSIDDGFGNVWDKCGSEDCGLQVVRPGVVQCVSRACERMDR